MAEKTIKTRIGLKIDTLANWSTSTLILKKGEVAFATAAADLGTGLTEPVIVMKVGDGSKTFAQLPDSFYAKASDVLAVCKSEEALENYVKGLITTTIKDTNTKIKAGDITFGENATVEFKAGNYIDLTPNAEDNTVTIEVQDKLGNDIMDLIAGSKIYTTSTEFNSFKTTTNNKFTEIDNQLGGLTGAMHFKGSLETLPATTDYAAGDVVIVDKKEYVLVENAGTKSWNELGDEGSYVLKTTTVNGKALSGNIELTHEDVGAEAKGVAAGYINNMNLAKVGGGTGEYIASISQTEGTVTATKGTLPTALKNPNALTFGSKTYDGSAAATVTASDLGALTEITTTANAGLKVTNKSKIDIDDDVTFVLDCGGAN